MKFIQNISGDFVRADKFTALTVEKDHSGKWFVFAYSDSYQSKLKAFDNEAEARSWLKEFVIQLDDELSGRNVTRAVFKDVTQLIKGMRHADSD